MRANTRNPKLKAEVRFCLRKSWKTEGTTGGPKARRLFLQSSAFSLMNLMKMAA
jgi:hypothetical protein